MKIKTFQAKTFGEALTLVRKEMGEDAVILSTDEQKGPHRVEVTAAMDYDLGAHAAASARMSYRPERAKMPAQRPAPAPAPAAGGSAEMLALKDEIAGLKEALEEMRDDRQQPAAPEGKGKIFHYLKKRSIRGDHAARLCERAGQVQELAGILSKEISTFPEREGRRVVVIIGPTGVGKTTTIAKLAARAIKGGKRTAIISLDTYRIGAVEQARIYARVMGIPLEVAAGIDALKEGLARHQDRDLVFIDTTGRNPRDEAYLQELSHIYTMGVQVETHLLASASSDADFLAESYKRYRRLPIDCIGFTKLDEAVKLGGIYNLVSYAKKPVAYVTTGQGVPHDIAFPDSAGLAEMIMRNGVA